MGTDSYSGLIVTLRTLTQPAIHCWLPPGPDLVGSAVRGSIFPIRVDNATRTIVPTPLCACIRPLTFGFFVPTLEYFPYNSVAAFIQKENGK